MATTTRKRRIDSLRPPQDIRENTQARRAWLAEQVAEISSQPNREARIVGTGSYQSVTVYAIDTITTPDQTRGHCQCCATDVAVDDAGRTAHHGYTRPGYGWQTRSCIGARHAAYELAHDKLDELLGRLAAYEHELSVSVARLRTPGATRSITVACDAYEKNAAGRTIRTKQDRTFTPDSTPAEVREQTGVFGGFEALVKRRAAALERELAALRDELNEQQRRRAAWTHNPEALRTVARA
jgi:hypothetical protein